MKMFNFIKYLTIPVEVTWEDTDLNYTVNGPRQTGKFLAKNAIHAWLWGTFYTMIHQRSGVYIKKL